MSLSDYQPETSQVNLGKTTVTVRGLTLGEIASLKNQYVVAFLEALEAYHEALVHPGNFQRGYGAASVVMHMADAVADSIALACDEPAAADRARTLSTGQQIRILAEIFRLTTSGHILPEMAPNILEMLRSAEPLRPEEIN